MESQEALQIKSSQENIQPALVKKNKWRKFIVIGIILLLLLLVTGTGVVVISQQKNSTGKNTKKTFSDSPLNNPLVQKLVEKLPIPKIIMIPITLAPTEMPSNDKTLLPNQTQDEPTIFPTYLPQDWKTYSNNTFNFSLALPSTLRAQENSLGLGIAGISFVNPDNNKAIYQILIYPKTIGKLIGMDFDILYALPVPSTMRMTTGKTSQIFTKTESEAVESLRSFEFRSTSDPPDPNVEAEIGAYIEIGESTLIISTGESNKAILNHMLSAFKYSLN